MQPIQDTTEKGQIWQFAHVYSMIQERTTEKVYKTNVQGGIKCEEIKELSKEKEAW